ncbi:MAG TPA: 2,3-diaminopropionate biosynthesis protein SbnA [Pyrinomonadaceae bacterium]|nr:2,3-diaminopropionate biosynthesis protein SbnA [Pyrinomonadaceae bacterium]
MSNFSAAVVEQELGDDFASDFAGRALAAAGILRAVGNTPLIRLAKLFGRESFDVYAKLEGMNPAGSSKDRPALRMIMRAIESGRINSSTTIIESSSGNLGIGLAQVCTYLDLRLVCVVDPNITEQNLLILRAYGAEIEMVTEPAAGGDFLTARVERVQQMLRTMPDAFWCNQYGNEHNPEAHHQTAEEILQALETPPDFLFCATSSCGTLRGCAEFIQARRLPTKLVAVDAHGSVIFGQPAAKRLIPGHGAARRPELYAQGLEDLHVHITDMEAVTGCRQLLRTEAIFAGGSSGAVVSAVFKLRTQIPPHSVSVLILPDRGERYLPTVYSDEWVAKHFGETVNLHAVPSAA